MEDWRGEGAIIHRRPFDAFVVRRKTARLDDLDPGAETSSGPDRRADILGDLRLEEDKTHEKAATPYFAGNFPIAPPPLATLGRTRSPTGL